MASVPLSYYDILDALQQPGCPLCRLLLRDTDRFLDSLLYEYSNSVAIHEKFRAARGLCNPHAWRLLHFRGGALNIALLQEAALDEVLALIARNEPAKVSRLSRWRGASEDPLAEQLAPTSDCLVCESLNTSEEHYATTFVNALSGEIFQNAFKQSSGLCLPHFRYALPQAQTSQVLQLLIDLQTAIWKKLQTELESFKNKYDFNNASMEILEEKDSWRRSLEALAGAQNVFGIRRSED